MPKDSPNLAPEPAGDFMADWLPRDSVAARLGVSVDTLQKWEARRCGPPPTRIGRRVLYRVDSLRAWMIEQERKPLQKR